MSDFWAQFMDPGDAGAMSRTESGMPRDVEGEGWEDGIMGMDGWLDVEDGWMDGWMDGWKRPFCESEGI